MLTAERVVREGGYLQDEQHLLASSLMPGKTQNRLALGIVLGVLAVFAVITAGLFSGFEPLRIDAFIPAYATAMFVNDMFTAILLFSQFSMLRSRALLVIASGYLFTALILLPWILTFPGLFAATGLIGGLQSTSALYLFWHGGFLLYVIGYALAKDRNGATQIRKGTVGAAVATSAALTVGAVAAAALISTIGEPLLPRVSTDSARFSPLWPYFVGAPIAALCVCALALLWTRRRSALDLWLMLVVCLYLVEVPLSFYPAPVRFSAGFYAVRVIGYLASSLVLLVLLYEIIAMYRLLGARAQRREREARLTTGDAVTASIAHEVRQPLTAMIANADAGLNLLRNATPDVERAEQAFERIVTDGHRTADILGSIRALYKSDFQNRASLDIDQLIRDALALLHGDLQRHGVRAQFEQTGPLPEVSGDQVQIRQVLLNLLTNAVDSMAAIDGLRTLDVKSEPCEGNGLVVSVADSGNGIAPQNLVRIFDPLFTTKSEGMGMGLSICRSIIERHGGRLWVAPNAPRGAVFRFSLHADKLAPTGG